MRATATRIGLFAGVMWVLFSSWAPGCGINWQKPSNHFDGVNERGFLSYWDEVAELDLGNGFKVPLIVNFRSNRDTVSPYGGYGWLVPLLESSVVQLEENRFMLVQPDGWNRYFGRRNAADTTLLGDGGWAAELKGNIFTAWASCGWKLVFANGKISSMVGPDNRRFDWVRSGDRITEIREGGTTRLTVKWNESNEMSAIEANGQQIAFGRGDKPRIQNMADQNVVAAIDRSLTQINLPSGISRAYAFGVDEKLNPTFKAGDRLFAWNSATKLALSDSGWTYQITPDPDGGYAAINRKNAQGQTEFWHDNRNKGVETAQGIDGVRTITTSFVNGKLAGKVRKIETIPGKSQKPTVVNHSYDENGRLLHVSRQIDGKTSTLYAISYNGQDLSPATKQYGEEAPLSFEYNDRKEVVAVARNGSPVYQKSFDSKLNAMVEKFEDGTLRIRKEASGGKRSEVLQFPDGTKQEKTYQDNELLSSVTTYQ